MERKIMHKQPKHIKAKSVDAEEMQHFAKMAEDWWNPNGKFRPLHIMNDCRIGFIKEEICSWFGKKPNQEKPLTGLKILDVGCGGGLLSEPMARLGADMVAIDALEANIKAARLHARQSGIKIDYRFGSVEDMAKGGERFDVVLNMEVLEHVTEPQEFIKTCATLVAEGGLMFCSTINRTAKAFALAIFGAEYIMRWLPKGTHQYDKFIKPEEMDIMLKQAGLAPDEPVGMIYGPLSGQWKTGSDASVNYIIKASRPAKLDIKT